MHDSYWASIKMATSGASLRILSDWFIFQSVVIEFKHITECSMTGIWRKCQWQEIPWINQHSIKPTWSSQSAQMWLPLLISWYSTPMHNTQLENTQKIYFTAIQIKVRVWFASFCIFCCDTLWQINHWPGRWKYIVACKKEKINTNSVTNAV